MAKPRIINYPNSCPIDFKRDWGLVQQRTFQVKMQPRDLYYNCSAGVYPRQANAEACPQQKYCLPCCTQHMGKETEKFLVVK